MTQDENVRELEERKSRSVRFAEWLMTREERRQEKESNL